MQPFVKENTKIAMKIFNWALDNTVVFKDENYQNLEDFHLAQKYPDEIIG